MSVPTSERIDELLDLAKDHLNNRSWFEYHSWDGLIECDETLTDAELEYMGEHFEVEVIVTIKQKQEK